MENRDLTKVIDGFINKKFEKRGLQKHEKLSDQAMEIIFQKKLWVSVIKINPALAKELISRNFHNRVIKDSRLTEFKFNMVHGDGSHFGWMMDGSPIKFDNLGNLIDGQHRLTSVIESDTTQEFIVVSGLEPKVFTIIDHHQKRSLGDTMHIAGYSNYAMVASALNFIFRIAFASMNYGGHDNVTTKLRYYTNYDYLAFAEKAGGNKFWAELCKEIAYLNKNLKVAFPPSATMGLLWILDQIDGKLGRKFMRDIYLGIQEYSSPAYLFRNRMAQWHSENDEKMPVRLMWAYLVKSWDHYYTGKKSGTLTIRKGENLGLKLNGLDRVKAKFPDFVK